MTFRIIGNEKDRARTWADGRFPHDIHAIDWGSFSALILEKDGCIRASVFYNGYSPRNSINMHIAAVDGGRWLTRPFLTAAFHYPFEQLGVRRVTALIAADNARVKRFIEHLGFVPEGVAREGSHDGIDLLIYGMLRRECRWLGDSKYGQDHANPPGPDSGGQRANGIEQGNGSLRRGA